MQLQLSTWPEVEDYLKRSSGIVIPTGSTEQHGPTGLIGTDAICPETIAREAGDEAGFMVGPTFNVGMAQHHMAFTGTISLRPATMVAVVCDWVFSLAKHGFARFYFLNGHGGNAPVLQTAFAEIYAARSMDPHGHNRPALKCMGRNWWELPGVSKMRKELYGTREGAHATPSEVAVTQYAYPDHIKRAPLDPPVAPNGTHTDAEDYRRTFPDGRWGSDPSLANPEDGKKLAAAAARDLIAEYQAFMKS